MMNRNNRSEFSFTPNAVLGIQRDSKKSGTRKGTTAKEVYLVL